MKEKTILKPRIIIISLFISGVLKIFHEWVLHGIKFFDQWGFFEFMNMLFYRYPLEKKGLKTKKNKKKKSSKRQSKKSI